MVTETENYEKMSNTGMYLTAMDMLNEEGYSTQLKGTIQDGLVLVVGFVTKFEMSYMKSRFPYISIVETLKLKK